MLNGLLILKKDKHFFLQKRRHLVDMYHQSSFLQFLDHYNCAGAVLPILGMGSSFVLFLSSRGGGVLLLLLLLLGSLGGSLPSRRSCRSFSFRHSSCSCEWGGHEF